MWILNATEFYKSIGFDRIVHIWNRELVFQNPFFQTYLYAHPFFIRNDVLLRRSPFGRVRMYTSWFGSILLLKCKIHRSGIHLLISRLFLVRIAWHGIVWSRFQSIVLDATYPERGIPAAFNLEGSVWKIQSIGKSGCSFGPAKVMLRLRQIESNAFAE